MASLGSLWHSLESLPLKATIYNYFNMVRLGIDLQ